MGNLLYHTKYEKIRLKTGLQLPVRPNYHCLRQSYIIPAAQVFSLDNLKIHSRITGSSLLFPKVKKTHDQILCLNCLKI